MAIRGQSPPYEAYAAIMGTFVGGLALVGGLARLLDRDPQEHTWLDLATLAAASFKASRTIAGDCSRMIPPPLNAALLNSAPPDPASFGS